MKIGILTYHRSHNYGALLQAVALRSFLKKLGHDVVFVDYWPSYHREMYSCFDAYLFKRFSLKNKLTYIYRFYRDFFPSRSRRRNFDDYIAKYILPYCSNPRLDEYDVVVYGSDQIWRKQSRLDNRFNAVYFGANELKTKIHVAYSASMGALVCSDEDCLFLKENLRKFAMIGVREASLQLFLLNCGIPNVDVTVDPSFLLSKKEWEMTFPLDPLIKKPYLLFYDLTPNSFDEDSVCKFAKKNGLEIVRIQGFANKKNKYSVCGPYEMLNYVRNADFVLSSSFHGLAFSLIFEKEFFCSFGFNSKRAEDLLEIVGLKDRYLHPLTTFSMPKNKIDYSIVCEKILCEKKFSVEFLNRINDIV